MDVCLACYKNRLASVFDNAADLLIFRDAEGELYPAGHLSLPSKDPMDRTSAILACGVNILICGAMCGRTRRLLEEGGVRVIAWVRGDVERVLDAFQRNNLDGLAMPGCAVGPRADTV